MSTIKVTNLRHESASSSNITLDSSNNAVVAGTLGCTGDLTITSGNLVVSSGNGIDFSATSGTGTSELLDDYEEGTWTVQVNNTTASSGVTSRYTKIGNKVTCECRFENAAFPTFSGTLEVSLPFAMASGLNMYPSGPLSYFYPLANWDTYSNFVGFKPYVAPGSSKAMFSIKLVDGDWQTSLSSSNTNVSGQSGIYLEFQLTYWTSW